jgi:1,4-alpha-glucan branching enzyme
MTPCTAEDGCPGFEQRVVFDPSQIGTRFRWGVALDAPAGVKVWAVPTEVARADSGERCREFVLGSQAQQDQDYYLTFARRLGARKHAVGAGVGLRFAVWAPHARAVDVVFAVPARGYIADDGTGIDPARPAIALARSADGIWTSPTLPDFDAYRGAPYMYRITNERGAIKYRTDLFSRAQAGHGAVDPARGAWNGEPATLDGTKSCSVIVGHDDVASSLAPGAPRISREEFWRHEFSPGRELPTRLEDLVIYELHLGGLAFGENRPGNLRDGIAFLDHLVELGVNAVELLPLSEFSGAYGWGYGDTHHLVIESSAGSLDEYRHFVRECHRRGIAVIQDVCYNHYDGDAERAQWQYDSELPEHNIYYWYEGKSADYAFADGGYLNNVSSGWAPRYHEEVVRQQFIASAALLLDDCHVDGFRVDLNQAFHRDNSLNANGRSVPAANLFGQKLLREWSRTLRLIKPHVFLIAEDHTGWDKVTESPDNGGLGFTARWDAAFYHHLIGDADGGNGRARLLRTAGFGGDGALDLDAFAASLYDSQYNRVVYHESHDEAGNAHGSARTLVTAVAGAPLVGATREYAEARARTVFGLSLFSAGTPMFFMGEEIGATEPYRYDDFRHHREDIVGARAGSGRKLFEFYREAIQLARRRPAARSQQIDILHVNPAGRVIAFLRRAGSDQLLIVASLANRPYLDGYLVHSDPSRLPSGMWHEVFNSDAAAYGGHNVGNFGAAIPAADGRFEARVPANGFLVFWKM